MRVLTEGRLEQQKKNNFGREKKSPKKSITITAVNTWILRVPQIIMRPASAEILNI